MQKIVPFLWFDSNAEEAVNFYVSLFQKAKIGNVARCSDMGPGPKGAILTAAFQLEGQDFLALNGGPRFKITPALSFFVNCATLQEFDALWSKLTAGGLVFMAVAKYPFSEKYGWVQDRFGVSWQVNLGPRTQKITPFLTFSGTQHGRAEEAMQRYLALFPNSGITGVARYVAGEPGEPGRIKHAVFTLAGQEFMASDSIAPHPFDFTEGLSLLVNCQTQGEVDALWDGLSADGEQSHCGWLKDKFGVWWQVIPTVLFQLMNDANPTKAGNVMRAMLKMGKIDIAALQAAHSAS